MTTLLVLLSVFVATIYGTSVCDIADEIRYSLALDPAAVLDCTGKQPFSNNGVVTFAVLTTESVEFTFQVENMNETALVYIHSTCKAAIYYIAPIIEFPANIYADVTFTIYPGTGGTYPNLRLSINTLYPISGSCVVMLSSTENFTGRPTVSPTSPPATVIPTSAPTSTPTQGHSFSPTSLPSLPPTNAPTFAPLYTRNSHPLSCHGLNALLVDADCASAIDIKRRIQTTFAGQVVYYTCIDVYSVMHEKGCLDSLDTPGEFDGWYL